MNKIRNIPIKVKKGPRVSIPDSSESSDEETFRIPPQQKLINIVELEDSETTETFGQVVQLLSDGSNTITKYLKSEFWVLEVHSNLEIANKSVRSFLFTILNNSLYQM